MADPTLKRTSVQINYTASDGYRAEVGYSNARSGTPESVFIEAMDELSRLCHLFGFGSQAREAFDNAAKRVNEWRGIAHPPAPVVRTSIGDTPAPQSTVGGGVDGIRYSSWCDKHRRGTPCDKCAAAGVMVPAVALPKPAVQRATWDGSPGWSQYHDERDPLPTEWDSEPPDEVIGFYSGDQVRKLLRAHGVKVCSTCMFPAECRELGCRAAGVSPSLTDEACRLAYGASKDGVPRLDGKGVSPADVDGSAPMVSGDSEANKEKG